jgi:hypothetical protein
MNMNIIFSPTLLYDLMHLHFISNTGQANVYQLKIAEERKEPYEEAKWDKEKIEIAAAGETKKVYRDDMPDRAVTIGAHLNPEEEKELTRFLNKNNDVFAWSAKDLQGVDRDIIEHALETNERIAPKKQKLRKMSEEKVKVVEAEVQRLQDAKVIKDCSTFPSCGSKPFVTSSSSSSC